MEEILFVIPCNQNTSDYDIDKVYHHIHDEIDSFPELSAYRRIRSIANAKMKDINFAIAIQYLTEDVKLISKLIKSKRLKHPEELKEFTENAIAIMDVWDNQYHKAFNTIKTFKDSYKAPKSIDEMNVEELREYIKKHNIK